MTDPIDTEYTPVGERVVNVRDLLEQVAALRAERDTCRKSLAPVLAVYEKFKHLDRVLSDERWITSGRWMKTDEFNARLLYDLWQAVKAAARAAAALVGESKDVQ